jgi:hypothetical protein
MMVLKYGAYCVHKSLIFLFIIAPDIDVGKGADDIGNQGDYLDGDAPEGKEPQPRGGYETTSNGVDSGGRSVADGAPWNELGLDQLARDAK